MRAWHVNGKRKSNLLSGKCIGHNWVKINGKMYGTFWLIILFVQLVSNHGLEPLSELGTVQCRTDTT